MTRGDLPSGDTWNARIGWSVAVGVTLVAIWTLVSEPSLWSVFSLALVAIIALPAVVRRDTTTMAPWPLLAIAGLAATARIGGVFGETAGHVAIATLALLIVVELDVFTPIELSRRFAVVFAVLTTMAIEAIWIIVQYVTDIAVGTNYIRSQTALQKDIVLVSATSIAIGVVFYAYVRRLDRDDLPGEPANAAESS